MPLFFLFQRQGTERPEMILTFYERIQNTPDCFSFYFNPETPVTWKAGQYATFIIPHDNPDDRGINRFFTIASSPHEGFIMVTTRYSGESSSTFKKAMMSLEKGKSITLLGPQGEFIIEDYSKSYALIAGGIGITPFRSILHDLEHNKKIKDMEIFLIYSSRNNDIVFKDDFDLFAANYSSFKVRYVISPEVCNAALISVAIPFFKERTYYISGPKGMVKAIEDGLILEGIVNEQLNMDYFPGY